MGCFSRETMSLHLIAKNFINSSDRLTLQCQQLNYSLFYKTLPKSNFQMHWISVRFYEIGDI